MLGRIWVNLPDLAAAKDYYNRLMPLMDFALYLAGADWVAYRPADAKPGTFLFLYPAASGQAYSRAACGRSISPS